MIDHTSFSVLNYELSLDFYDQTLKTLNYERIITIDIPEQGIQAAGYGNSSNIRPSLWISPMGNENEDIGKARGVHIAFIANSVKAVDDWYSKCLELGAVDNGAPGPRAEYHPGYYGAFVIDHNGWRIEAVFHNNL